MSDLQDNESTTPGPQGDDSVDHAKPMGLSLSASRRIPESSPKKDSSLAPKIVYGGIALVAAFALIFVMAFSTSARTEYHPNDQLTRDSLLWDAPPKEMSEQWKLDGYNFLVNTPGAMVAGTDNGIYRLDATDGHRLWSYERPGHLCHMINSSGNIVALYDDGQGCSEVIQLDAATGKYMRQAQFAISEADRAYGTNSARLTAGAEGRIALSTRSFVRILRSDLVPSSQFGTPTEPLYETTKKYSNCHIYDVAVGPKLFTVASKCAEDATIHIRAVQVDPEDANKADVPVDVDSGLTPGNPDDPNDPRQGRTVTLPVISISMFTFVVSGDSPSAYTWQLDKDKAEVSREHLGPGEYGFTYQDVDGIGYVWRIGSTVHSRSGSEDLSRSVTRDGAIGEPMSAGDDLLVPRKDSILAWRARSDVDTGVISVPGLDGKRFAFSGKTVASLNEDTHVITGYASNE